VISRKVGASSRDFEFIEEIGKGAHGVVHKVRSLKNNQVYVMKKVNFAELKSNHRREAIKEVQILKRLNNPHIIK